MVEGIGDEVTAFWNFLARPRTVDLTTLKELIEGGQDQAGDRAR